VRRLVAAFDLAIAVMKTKRLLNRGAALTKSKAATSRRTPNCYLWLIHYCRAALADVGGLLERISQLQDSPVVVMSPDDLKPDRKPAG
jgi:hypothetical protein